MISRLALTLTLLLSSVGASGCKRAEKGPEKAPAVSLDARKSGQPDAMGKEPVSDSVRVATFNAGLARNYVPYVEERLPEIIEELGKVEADVVCLQEVWEERDAKAIASGVKTSFPYNFRLESARSILAPAAGSPSCGEGDLKGLSDCVGQECATAPDKTGCVMKQCGTHFLGLPSNCRTCLAANVSKPLHDIVTTCSSKGVSLGYDGANGLMLLSRSKFHDVTNVNFDSFLMQRAVLHGRVGVRGGDLHIFCTHFSTPMKEVEYAGKFDSWQAEQLAQVERTIEFAKEEAGDHPAVLLGDLNQGPANAEWEVEAEFPDHFQLFLDAGFRSPYTKDHGHCTFCAIEALGAEGAGRILDHALFLNFAEELLLPERTMERRVVVGEGLKVPLSDHYGVKVEFELP